MCIRDRREGVQRDILPIVEGSVINTKHGPVKTDHILFIGAGAFHTAKPTDLIPELQGRFPIRVELENLDKDTFVKILTVPENALLKQHKALLETEGIEIEFTEEAIDEDVYKRQEEEKTEPDMLAREQVRQQLREGLLEEQYIEIQVTDAPKTNMLDMGNEGMSIAIGNIFRCV